MAAMKRDAVSTPYVGEDGRIYWEWSHCPDCGVKHAHHHDKNGRGGVRCG
jgi:ribosomal protein S27AE